MEEWRAWGISARLAQVAAFFPESYVALDIGTDHALLPLALTRSRRAPAALAADINAAPLLAAKRRLTPHDTVALARADGFEALRPELGGDALNALTGDPHLPICVTICGVGGKLISTLMERAPARVTRAVLQPNLQHHRVAEALAHNGWSLEAARFTLEGDRLFLTLLAARGGAEGAHDHARARTLDALLREDPLYPLWLWINIEQLSTAPVTSLQGLPVAAAEHWRSQRARREALVASLSELMGPPLTPQE